MDSFALQYLYLSVHIAGDVYTALDDGKTRDPGDGLEMRQIRVPPLHVCSRHVRYASCCNESNWRLD